MHISRPYLDHPSETDAAHFRDRQPSLFGFLICALLAVAGAVLVSALDPGPFPATCGDDPASVCAGP